MHWSRYCSELLVAASVLSTVLSTPISLHETSLSRRVDRTPADAEDPDKVVEWLKTAEGVDPKTLIFYSGDAVHDAEKFNEVNGDYLYFGAIFDEEFLVDFGGATLSDKVIISCSKAMGRFAEGETRVFGDKDAKADSYWRTYEKPELMSNTKVTKIWDMQPGTTDPNNHNGDLKAGNQGPAPPQPATKTLQLFYSEFSDEISGVQYYWKFYMGQAGLGIDPCDVITPIHPPLEFDAPDFEQPPTTVDGEWDLDVEGTGCRFQGIGRVGEGGELGYLHCPDRQVQCFPDLRPNDNCGVGSEVNKAIAHCDW